MKLKTPIDFEGKPIEEISLQLDTLTGGQLLAIERRVRAEMHTRGEVPLSMETDSSYLIAVAAAAAGKPVELFESLRAADFTAIKMAVQNFLLGPA